MPCATRSLWSASPRTFARSARVNPTNLIAHTFPPRTVIPAEEPVKKSAATAGGELTRAPTSRLRSFLPQAPTSGLRSFLPSPWRGGVGGGGTRREQRVREEIPNHAASCAFLLRLDMTSRVFTPPLTPPRQGEGNSVPVLRVLNNVSRALILGGGCELSEGTPKLRVEREAQAIKDRVIAGGMG
jgi:hypothetical protein